MRAVSGPTGATGLIGGSTIVMTTAATAGGPAAGTLVATPTANCSTVSATSKLLGGGAEAIGGGTTRGAVSYSRPNPQSGTPTGWQAQGVVTISGTGALTINAYAICSTP
jgi:hypothetical protein